MKTKPVSELFIEDREIDQEYSNWADKMEALASFIVDYEYLKNKQSYSQENIARKAGTTQSAISRLVRMKGKPTYDLLQRVSSAVDGKLFISPLGEFTTTLNYEFHDRAISYAEKEGVEVSTLLRRILNEYFDNEKIIEDVHV
jgi:transcriptional regulator with XRE-family HTH domain